MFDPHKVLTQVAELAGHKVPADLVADIVGPLDAARERLREHEATRPTEGALPSALGDWDRDRRELGRRRTDQLLRSQGRVHRHADRLIELLQPVHADAAATIHDADDRHPQLHKITAAKAVDLDVPLLQAWKARRDAVDKLRSIERLVDCEIRPNLTRVTVKSVDGRPVWLDAGELASWWTFDNWSSDAVATITRRINFANAPAGAKSRGPSWFDIHAAGGVRTLKTRAQVERDVVVHHNVLAERSPVRTAHNQPAMRPVVPA